MAFLSLGEKDHVDLIRQNPQRAITLYEVINNAKQYSQQLQEWANAMKIVHARAQVVAEAVAEVFPNMGVGVNSNPRLEAAGVGHA